MTRRSLIGQVRELAPGTSKKFMLECGDGQTEAMLVNFDGKLYAYLNRCRHIAIPLDWADNEFFTTDKRYLICANHGAIYEPRTGECVWGPCAGESLHRVPLEIEGEKVFAHCPYDHENGTERSGLRITEKRSPP
jgi:nitrite reductase/ring-hydroxylating ferredoxin subunit